jgi:hypothetical protein
MPFVFNTPLILEIMKLIKISSKSILLFLIVNTFVVSSSIAQQANVWAFGWHYGLDFNSGSPVFFDTTAINYIEGSASVCDSAGQLLFYTDGTTVWNKLHQQMPNGFGMASGNSTTQPAIILPIANSSLFYIFTTESLGPNPYSQLKYHIVDMASNGGLGMVTIKNQLLLNDVTEKLAAVGHCNGQDWWIVTQKAYGDNYASFLLHQNGVVDSAIYSATGFFHQNDYDTWIAGQLKISPNGKYYINSSKWYGVEIGSFDDVTGQLEIIALDISPTWKDSYGCAFSFDSKFIFASLLDIDSITANDTIIGNEIVTRNVVRYNIENNDSALIMQSKFALYQRDSINRIHAMQLGPDGNIYVRSHISDTTELLFGRDKLFVIKPDNDSLIETVIYFAHPNIESSLGLPSFPDAIFTNHHKAILCMPTCVAGVYDSIPFYDSLLTTTRDYIWDFGDPASGVNNTANAQYPVHTFSAPGTYTVTLTLPSDCNPISVTQQVTIAQTPPMVPLISVNNIYLESTAAAQYQWYLNSNIIIGANSQTYLPITNGNYTVTITDSLGCGQTSLPFNLTSVAFKNLQNKSIGIVIYPNPAKDALYINTKNTYKTYIIYNVLGAIIQSGVYSNSINIAAIAKGSYLLSLQGLEGNVQKMWVKE